MPLPFCSNVLAHIYKIIFITHEINRRLNVAEKKISEPGKIVIETIQSKTGREKSVEQPLIA